MSRYFDYKNSIETLQKIDANKKDYLFIHYSCESFYDKTDGYSPRITSIAIRKVDDGQTELFAIHKIAEIRNILFDEITEHYDELEQEMLTRYFEYVLYHTEKTWIHWNMRDSNYGFKALEHRAEVLGVKPVKIDDNHKIDMALLFIQRYGDHYVQNPKMKNLIEKNHMNPKDLLYGKEEAEAFENKEYIKLGMSAASKVKVFSSFLNLAIDNKLAVDSTKFEIYGSTFKGWCAIIQDKTWCKIVISIINLIIGGLIGALISKFIN